jgi:hypothetical protein
MQFNIGASVWRSFRTAPLPVDAPEGAFPVYYEGGLQGNWPKAPFRVPNPAPDFTGPPRIYAPFSADRYWHSAPYPAKISIRFDFNGAIGSYYPFYESRTIRDDTMGGIIMPVAQFGSGNIALGQVRYMRSPVSRTTGTYPFYYVHQLVSSTVAITQANGAHIYAGAVSQPKFRSWTVTKTDERNGLVNTITERHYQWLWEYTTAYGPVYDRVRAFWFDDQGKVNALFLSSQARVIAVGHILWAEIDREWELNEWGEVIPLRDTSEPYGIRWAKTDGFMDLHKETWDYTDPPSQPNVSNSTLTPPYPSTPLKTYLDALDEATGEDREQLIKVIDFSFFQPVRQTVQIEHRWFQLQFSPELTYTAAANNRWIGASYTTNIFGTKLSKQYHDHPDDDLDYTADAALWSPSSSTIRTAMGDVTDCSTLGADDRSRVPNPLVAIEPRSEIKNRGMRRRETYYSTAAPALAVTALTPKEDWGHTLTELGNSTGVHKLAIDNVLGPPGIAGGTPEIDFNGRWWELNPPTNGLWVEAATASAKPTAPDKEITTSATFLSVDLLAGAEDPSEPGSPLMRPELYGDPVWSPQDGGSQQIFPVSGGVQFVGVSMGNWVGTVTFQYRIFNGYHYSDPITVTITREAP